MRHAMHHAYRRDTAALLLAVCTTACFTVRSRQPPGSSAEGTRRGEHVRVDLPPYTVVHVRSADGDTASVEAAYFTGTVADVRGDTLVLGDPRTDGAYLRFPAASGAEVLAAAVLLTPESHARVTTRHLSGWRTTALVVGLTAAAGSIALAALIAAVGLGF
jgi:hypothetical protein